jgi:hypothetical protein
LGQFAWGGYGQREHRLASLLEIYATERSVEQQPAEMLVAMYGTCGGQCA